MHHQAPPVIFHYSALSARRPALTADGNYFQSARRGSCRDIYDRPGPVIYVPSAPAQRQQRRTRQFPQHPARLHNRGRPPDHGSRVTRARRPREPPGPRPPPRLPPGRRPGPNEAGVPGRDRADATPYGSPRTVSAAVELGVKLGPLLLDPVPWPGVRRIPQLVRGSRLEADAHGERLAGHLDQPGAAVVLRHGWPWTGRSTVLGRDRAAVRSAPAVGQAMASSAPDL